MPFFKNFAVRKLFPQYTTVMNIRVQYSNTIERTKVKTNEIDLN